MEGLAWYNSTALKTLTFKGRVPTSIGFKFFLDPKKTWRPMFGEVVSNATHYCYQSQIMLRTSKQEIPPTLTELLHSESCMVLQTPPNPLVSGV